jgi:hypothetical protein
LEGVVLRELPARTGVLSFQSEGDDGGWESSELRFYGVEAFKCTYLHALTSEMISSAYDKLVDMGSSQWLGEVNAVRARLGLTTSLKHLRICFDDGPCYEFLCAAFEVAVGGMPSASGA